MLPHLNLGANVSGRTLFFRDREMLEFFRSERKQNGKVGAIEA